MWTPPWTSGSFSGLNEDIASGGVIVYRGARDGNPEKLPRGPTYFATLQGFAASYGPTAAFRLTLKNPYIVSREEWHKFSNSAFYPMESVVKALKDQSAADGVKYDSVIADFGPLHAIFVLNGAKVAKLA